MLNIAIIIIIIVIEKSFQYYYCNILQDQPVSILLLVCVHMHIVYSRPVAAEIRNNTANSHSDNKCIVCDVTVQLYQGSWRNGKLLNCAFL